VVLGKHQAGRQCIYFTRSIHQFSSSVQYAMRFLARFLCAVALVAAKPIDPLATTQKSQRVLHNHAPRIPSISRPVHHISNFDAAPNSVGLLLTSAGKQRVMHVWLPLGKRIETRKCEPHISSTMVVPFVSDTVCGRRFDQPPVSSNLGAHHYAHPQLA